MASRRRLRRNTRELRVIRSGIRVLRSRLEWGVKLIRGRGNTRRGRLRHRIETGTRNLRNICRKLRSIESSRVEVRRLLLLLLVHALLLNHGRESRCLRSHGHRTSGRTLNYTNRKLGCVERRCRSLLNRGLLGRLLRTAFVGLLTELCLNIGSGSRRS